MERNRGGSLKNTRFLVMFLKPVMLQKWTLDLSSVKPILTSVIHSLSRLNMGPNVLAGQGIDSISTALHAALCSGILRSNWVSKGLFHFPASQLSN